MNPAQLIKMREKVGSFIGGESQTVGKGGYYSNIGDAVGNNNTLEQRLELVKEWDDTNVGMFNSTTALNITSGSFNVIAQPVGSTLFRDSAPWTFDYFVRVGDADTNYYKVKNIVGDTYLNIAEPFLGASVLGAATIRLYKLRRASFILLPGEHYTPLSEGVAAYSGINIVGIDKYNTFLSEAGGVPQGPFTALVDSYIGNLTLAPTDAWAALDAVGDGSQDATAYAGATNVFDNVVINATNQGAHGGGSTNIPVTRGGRTFMRNCEFILDSLMQAVLGGRVTETVSNTRLEIHNSQFTLLNSKDLRAGTTPPLAPMALYAHLDITYRMKNCDVNFSGDDAIGLGASIGPRSVVSVVSDARVDLHNVQASVVNTAAFPASGVHVSGGAAATVNMSKCDIDVTTATGDGYGVFNDTAGSTINIRGSRIKGTTASVQNSGGGTVNYDAASTLVGGASVGAISQDT